MIYGYDSCTVNDYGLKQMREISISANPASMRGLAEFLIQTAGELESTAVSIQWHRHAPTQLARELGCDVVLLAAEFGAAGHSKGEPNGDTGNS